MKTRHIYLCILIVTLALFVSMGVRQATAETRPPSAVFGINAVPNALLRRTRPVH